jgi:excisionase family DNA binding protein
MRVDAKIGKMPVGQGDSGVRRLADLPDVLTVEEAGRVLRVGRNSAYELVRSGRIASKRVGRRMLVPRTAVERWLAEAGARD